MNILLSGESGFVGQNLKSFLHDRNDVKFLYLKRTENASPGNLTWENLEIPSDIATVVHLAGKAHDIAGGAKPEVYYEANFELTKKLYKAYLLSDAQKFIFISSIKAVANRVENELSEDEVPSPGGHYGKSKLMAEEFIINQKLPPGKSYYILRPCMIHGPGNKGNLNLLYNFFVLKRFPYPLAAFNNRRSFLSVENLCFIINELVNRDDIPSGIYNVADSESLSTSEVIDILSESTGKPPRFLFIPPALINVVVKVCDSLNLGLTTGNLEKLTCSFVVSTEKLKRYLKRDLPLSAREGIRQTGLSFKTQRRQ